MNAKMQLSILDYNNNVGRIQEKSSDGEEKFRYMYPKATKDWIAKPIFAKKNSSWRINILVNALDRVRTGISQELKPPTSVPKNIAKQPCPEQDVLRQHASARRKLFKGEFHPC